MPDRFLPLFTIVLAAITTVAHAAPERSVALGAALRWSVWDDSLRESWDPGLAVEASVAYRRGADVARIGAETIEQSSRVADVPDFRSVFVFGGWERDLRLGTALRGFAGLRTGLHMMWFDVEATRTIDPRESELAFGGVGGLRRDLGAWSLALTGEYRLVMTEPHVTQVLVGIDVSRRIAALR